MKYSRIIGMGSYLPEKILSNFDLEKIFDTSDQWITERTGIKERRILDASKTLVDMAEIAAKRALEVAAISSEEIDLIIVSGNTSKYLFPNTSSILQYRLGIKNRPAFDINAACAGFIYGLSIADQYLQAGKVKCILLVACEAMSKIVDWQDRSTAVLFGDGAGAAILKADTMPGLRSVHIHADGSFENLLFVPSGLYDGDKPYVNMKGNEVFRVAVEKLSQVIQETIDYNKIKPEDIDWFVPHQANFRIINAMAKKINLPMEKVILTIDKQGNTSAASVPLALDVGIRDGRIKKGDTILMEAFGSGFTWGAALLDY